MRKRSSTSCTSCRGNKPDRGHRSCTQAISEPSASWRHTKTGDTLSTKAAPIVFGRTEISKPYTYMRYKAKNKGDEDKISQALAKMMEEDLTLKNVNDSENRQTLLYGMGDQHLDVVVSKLAREI